MEEPPALIFYKGYKYRRYPDSPQRSHRVYYQRSVPWGVTYLHRDIWLDTHPGEEIPDKWHVHHKDEDPFNNDPSNLELLSPAEHNVIHPGDQSWEEDNLLEHLDRIRPMAAEWHSSEEGRAWHSEHGKATWEGREPQHDKICAECGTAFKSWVDKPVRAKTEDRYCSRLCVNRARDKNPKYRETVTCPACGVEFERDKYRKTRPECCSRKCSWVMRKRRAA